MPIVSFIVAYDGRPFEGWQSQPSKNTVQDHLELAFLKLLNDPVRVHGSGRTDSGVHATGQVFHVELESLPSITEDKWPIALNTKLPHSIRVLSAKFEDDGFHARFSAIGKIYRYTISQSQILNPFDDGLVWHNSRPMDVCLLTKALAMLEGTHDFRSFAALRGNEPTPIPHDYFIRTIYGVQIEEDGEYVRISFHGNGFMYKMVRLLVGGICSVAMGKLSLDELSALLKGTTEQKSPYCAPASGLTLMKVVYENRP